MLRGMRVVLAAVAVAVLLGVPAAQSATPPKLRTVIVVPAGKSLPATAFTATRNCLGPGARTCVNGKDGLELVYAVRGALPKGSVTGKVLTDTNCDPDLYGVSHCVNVIRLAGGREITVRHDHQMMNDPCLSPGETVRVQRL